MAPRTILPRVRRRAALVAGAVLVAVIPAVGLAAPAQAAPTIRETAVPTPAAGPADVAVGPDGAVWFTEANADKIGRVRPNGQITEFPLPAGSEPHGITGGPDGAVWFAETGTNTIGRMTTAGALTEFPTHVSGSAPTQIALGPDGNLWFTETLADRIGRVTPAGVMTEVFTGMSSINPEDITTGPDGNMWFTAFPDPEGLFPGWVGRITTDTLQITLFPTSAVNDDVTVPLGITTGPDGNLWITGPGNGTVGKVTTAGVVTVFHLPQGVVSGPAFITTGTDGAMWFTEQGLGSDAAGPNAFGNRIGRITTSGTIRELPVPTADSVPLGITVGPDRRIWFAESAGDKLGRVVTGR
jgi:virginiamycin B lyase